MDDRIPSPPSVAGIPPNLGERLARLESGQDWIKVLLALMGAVMIGGFAFLGMQINRLDSKIDALGGRIEAQGAQTRQELLGIANAITNSITATKQVQPQIVILPMPAAPSAPVTPKP